VVYCDPDGRFFSPMYAQGQQTFREMDAVMHLYYGTGAFFSYQLAKSSVESAYSIFSGKDFYGRPVGEGERLAHAALLFAPEFKGGGLAFKSVGLLSKFEGWGAKSFTPVFNFSKSLWGRGVSGVERNVPKGSSNAFESLMQHVDTLDFRTPMNSAVFYSGPGQGARASAFAQITDRATIEMTHGGKALAGNSAFQSLSPAEQFQVWQKASVHFAEQSSGKIHAFLNGARPDRTFMSIEKPILDANKNVYSQIYHY
jgi:hypothetical protein